MIRPNFAAMPIADLRAYVLNHRTDDEAFYALANRVHTEGVELQSLEDLTKLIETKQKVRENQSE
ncbi:DUF6887 family protein [Stenomitos frigidus]|uniref:Uncharacterized protein n=1 Tax=Stenomitos frigidus ULC18 TaxID=2107698 RepID=A0A2T1DVL9_9CYAN|nr:hypothetical protein [Stenomitos frigidus]PSB24512.1 hypothetical protein C7B82_26095 [Stenomitos frigidus ULC18]